MPECEDAFVFALGDSWAEVLAGCESNAEWRRKYKRDFVRLLSEVWEFTVLADRKAPDTELKRRV